MIYFTHKENGTITIQAKHISGVKFTSIIPLENGLIKIKQINEEKNDRYIKVMFVRNEPPIIYLREGTNNKKQIPENNNNQMNAYILNITEK